MAETNDVEDVMCRTCLTECFQYKSIFKVGVICGEITTLSAMLTECSSVEFNEEDSLPRFICLKCVRDLSRAYIFKQTVLKSNETLREQQQIIKNEEDMVETIYFFENDENEADEDDNEGADEVNDTVIQEGDEMKMEINENNIASEFEIEIEQEISSSPEEDLSSVINSENDQNRYISLDTVSSKAATPADQIDGDISTTVTQLMQTKEELINAHLKTNQILSRKRKNKQFAGSPFKCEICGKQLSNYSSHKYHMQLHSDTTPFLCSQCGEGFKTRNAYDGHMTTHNSLNPNSCNICGKIYRQASSLRSHVLTHTGEKPFLCGICGKGMTQKSGFKKHMLVHTGEKPFKCDICQKEFRYSSNLNAHKRGHIGEKPYDCKTCEKRFNTREQLKRHNLTHSGEKPYSCETCGKSFTRRSSLIVHKQIHTIGNRRKLAQKEVRNQTHKSK